ncbi:diguanylate cyclase domain-containing protein [Paenibacillus pasadenensis]|uniref:Phytochrome, two-component sensor histidine kinase n=1 Tax=Paenibacillus pasadenensis TaxID=217090 RepID=A0A2N5N9U6_9BACL|nr:diguanylate cyclase [Paenibacillus pasadenensis]PLT47103.1 Phytochrome, two-component sensor histidine kinase [Paenibacillus pasadenensis]
MEEGTLDRTLLDEGEYEHGAQIDLTNCDKEPIHIPGSIQPHGALLAVTRDERPLIVQASRSTLELFGYPAEELIGQPLERLVGQDKAEQIASTDPDATMTADLHYVAVPVSRADGSRMTFTGIVHVSEGLLILELEPCEEELGPSLHDFQWINTFFSRIKQASSRIEASQAAAEQVKEMLGYDRVMIYEFDADWNGKVIAEAKEEGLEPFLGHHYPASDIPKQARALYLRNWLRTIVDVRYEPSAIVPTVQPLTGKPLNLSLSSLRSVSPLHIEYLGNMGVAATTTISLIHDGELWGLITCHHYSPKYVPHRVRSLCNFLGAFFSNELYQRQQLEEYERTLSTRSAASRLTGLFAGGNALRTMQKVEQSQRQLLELLGASGAAVCFRDKLQLFGRTPTASQVRELAGWMGAQSADYAYHTSRLGQEYAPAAAYADKAAGAVFLALSPGLQHYILWFRPEQVEVVEWAGDPAKAVIQADDGLRLSPRKSFEKWREVIKGKSEPWKESELSALQELKSIVQRETEHQLVQAEEQALQNARVLRDNENRYLQLMEYSPVPFLTVTGGRVVYANGQAAELLGCKSARELEGAGFLDFFDEQGRGELGARLDSLGENVALLDSYRGTFLPKGSGPVELDLTLASVIHGGEPSAMVIAKEVKAEPEQKENFSHIASQLESYVTSDSLTDLPSRLTFERDLEADWDEPERTGEPLSLLLVDIDDFRSYNALHGFRGGDLCLQWVADALGVISKQHGAYLARITGDTFVLKLREDEEAAARLAEEIRSSVLSLQIPRDGASGGFISVGTGAATARPADGQASAQLLQAAQEALRQAKAAGTGRGASASPQ